MKNLISILIIMISLMAFGFFGLLLTLDYKKVQQDLTILLAQHTNNTAGVIGRVEVRKVPFPAIIIHDITIPGVLNAKEALVDFTIRSLLRRNPQINKITIDEPSLHLVIHANYEDDNLSYGRATLRASHIGEFLSNYPDLQDAIVGTIPADSTNITFDIVASDQYLTLTNMDVKSQFMTCSGQVALSRAVGLASNLKLNCDQILLLWGIQITISLLSPLHQEP
jgi:hypothetical protein